MVHPYDPLGGCEAKYAVIHYAWEYTCPFDRGYMLCRRGGEDS